MHSKLREVPGSSTAGDMAQLGAGSVLPLGPMASSTRLEERPGENLTLLAEATDLVTPPYRCTPQPDTAELPPDHGTSRRQHASKASSEPPPDINRRHWQSLLNTDGRGDFNYHLNGEAETTTTPHAHKEHTSSSLLLPRAAASTPTARHTQPTYPPGAGAPFSSHVSTRSSTVVPCRRT